MLAHAFSRVRCVKLRDVQHFSRLLQHCTVCSSVKLWYNTRAFVRDVMGALTLHAFSLERPASGVLKQSGVKMRSLDVYPYSSVSSASSMLHHSNNPRASAQTSSMSSCPTFGE